MKTIAIFCAGQKGDILTITSVLKYREKLWGDCRIVWYIADENRDLLKHQDIELRTFPRGFGYPEMVEFENKILTDLGREPIWEDWQPLVDWDNRMNVALKSNYPSLADIDIGYFPAPHQMTPAQRHGLEYPNISKKVFGVPQEWPWHPVISITPEEDKEVTDFMMEWPQRKIIALETMAGSGQSKLTDAMVRRTMEMCKEVLGSCAFVFVSDKYLNGNEQFPEDIYNHPDDFFAGHFPVRLCSLVVGLSDLLISVSSGITVAASAWRNTETSPVQYLNTPVLQYTGSTICSTRGMAIGRFELVTTDENPVAEAQYYQKLRELLNDIK